MRITRTMNHEGRFASGSFGSLPARYRSSISFKTLQYLAAYRAFYAYIIVNLLVH